MHCFLSQRDREWQEKKKYRWLSWINFSTVLCLKMFNALKLRREGRMYQPTEWLLNRERMCVFFNRLYLMFMDGSFSNCRVWSPEHTQAIPENTREYPRIPEYIQAIPERTRAYPGYYSQLRLRGVKVPFVTSEEKKWRSNLKRETCLLFLWRVYDHMNDWNFNKVLL